MKLARLDLDRYGPFTQAQLDFRVDADLHIVYGPNEAGKSSALSAVTDLLYGFEPRSTANFRHRYEDLRIGATVLHADGRLVSLWRRKRLRNSLTDAADVPLEGPLDAVLSGISREVFLAAFGLDQQGMRNGARQMLASQGEVGESLFAAASGLKTLVSVRTSLESEADTLFGARKSSKRAFYEAQERYDLARGALRERSLRADDVRELEDQISAQEASILSLAEQLRSTGVKRARIDRVRRIAPLLARITAADQAATPLQGLPDLPDDFAPSVEKALAHAQSGRETLARLGMEVLEARDALSALEVNEAFLQAEEEVKAVNDDRAALAKAMLDRPRREVEARDLARDLDNLALRLGQSNRAALTQLRPDDLALERIRVLSDQRRVAETALAESARAAIRARESIRELERRASAITGGIDPGPLRQRLRAIQPALAGVGSLYEQEADLARRQEAFQERLKRLSPTVSRPECLWDWHEPSEEVLARSEHALAELDVKTRQLLGEAHRLGEALAASDAAVAAPFGEEDLVDQVLLVREREERNALFEAVVGEPSAAAAKAYRKIAAQVDALADKRFAQAERLAQREMLLRTRDREVEALAILRQAIAAAHTEREAAEMDWRALFAPLGLDSTAPSAMRRFLTEFGRLREERQTLRELERRIEQGTRRLDEERPALEKLAVEAGLVGVTGQSLGTLARLIEEQLSGMEEGAREARSIADQLATKRKDFEQAETSANQAKGSLIDLQANWAIALEVIGLQAQASPQEAARATELWIAVHGKLALLEGAEHRIASILDDRDGFARRAQALAETLLPGDVQDPANLAQALMAGLMAAREAAARRHAAEESLARLEAALAQAQAIQHHHDEAIGILAAKAGCVPSGLASLASDLLARGSLRAELAQARTELKSQGDGFDEATLRSEAGGIDADQAAGEIEILQAQLAGLAEEDKQAALALGDLRRKREAIEREAGAAGAAQSLEDARGDLERITRDYLVLKTASLMIEAGLERQLKSEQGPLIARAGGLFSTITRGGFAGIATLYDSDDHLRLVARRTDGGTTPIEGLSEGTRDQLYLSLRLANLEGMAERREVPPFIGDDLVMTFDEDRVAAALQVLAVKGSSLQKILFTHHRHVVDIARERLGESVDVVFLGAGG